MRARPGLAFSPVQGSPEGLVAVIVEDQVGVSAGAVEPALDAILRSRDSGGDCALRSDAVSIGRGGRNMALVRQSCTEFVIAAADMLAKHMSADGFILCEVARRALPELGTGCRLAAPRGIRGGSGARGRRRLARDRP